MAPNPLQLVRVPLNLALKAVGSVFGAGSPQESWDPRPADPGHAAVARERDQRPAATEEQPVAEAEPTPAELAARGEGRKPAPLGSDEGRIT